MNYFINDFSLNEYKRLNNDKFFKILSYLITIYLSPEWIIFFHYLNGAKTMDIIFLKYFLYHD